MNVPSEDSPCSSVAELLKLNDAAFVRAAYLSVLGRPADPEGFANYLAHVRAGEDRLSLIRALALSSEGAELDPDRLSGLKDATNEGEQKKQTFLSRLLSGAMTLVLKPLIARLDVIDYRLSKLEQQPHSMKKSGSISASISGDERQELAKLSVHARAIYFRLKDSQIKTDDEQIP